MAVTTKQVLTQALQEILVQGSETPLEADEYRDAIFVMNSWFADLLANGVDLGYTVVDSLTDIVTIPDGAVMGAISNLAIALAPQFGGMTSAELAKKAKKGMATIYKLGQIVPDTELPSTLPVGTGNNSGVFTSNFYPGSADANS